MPKTEPALCDEVLIEAKLLQLAQVNHGGIGHPEYRQGPFAIPTQPLSRNNIAPEEVIRMLDTLSIK